jgi:hypothetical protein
MNNSPALIAFFSAELEKTFSSLKNGGYTIFSTETSDFTDPGYIFHRQMYQNKDIDRTIYFDLTLQPDDITMDVFIWSEDDRVSSLSVMDYIEYEKTGQQLPFSCCFGLAEEYFQDDLKQHFEQIEGLFNNELQDVLAGKEMIHIPMKDPRK